MWRGEGPHKMSPITWNRPKKAGYERDSGRRIRELRANRQLNKHGKRAGPVYALSKKLKRLFFRSCDKTLATAGRQFFLPNSLDREPLQKSLAPFCSIEFVPLFGVSSHAFDLSLFTSEKTAYSRRKNPGKKITIL